MSESRFRIDRFGFLLESEAGSVTGLSFLPAEGLPSEAPSDPLAQAVFRQLTEYFEGRRTSFDFPVLERGTEFQKRVWAALRAVPHGRVSTYGELAKVVGAGSPRAVGGACARNPLMLYTPCHRIVGAGGRPVGFRGGIELKLLLLKREGALP